MGVGASMVVLVKAAAKMPMQADVGAILGEGFGGRGCV